MKSPCKKTALALMLCFVTGLFVPRAETEAGEQTLISLPPSSGPAFQVDPLYSEVRRLVMRYYPEASFEKRGNRIRFASGPLALVQSAASAKDPWGLADKTAAAGIDCHIAVVSGKSSLSASSAVPSRTVSPSDVSASTTSLSSPYSPTLDAHIEVRIESASSAPRGFVQELTSLVSDFDSTVTR